MNNDNRINKNVPFDFELANSIINSLQQNSYSFNQNCPSIEIPTHDDDINLLKLVGFLEDFSRKRQTLVQVNLCFFVNDGFYK